MKKVILLFLIVVLISGCGKPLNNVKSEAANTVAQKPEQAIPSPTPIPVLTPTTRPISTPSPSVMPVPSESFSSFRVYMAFGATVVILIFYVAFANFVLNCIYKPL
jgi:hypothetical protein